MKVCKSCEKNLFDNWFNEQTGDRCILCFSKTDKVEVAKVEKSTDYEEIEDTGCAGGACTL